MKRPDESYDEFYARGGWQYDPMAEILFLVYRILQPLRVPAGARVLELGSGTGLHAYLLQECGLRVTALERSPVGVEVARRTYPGPDYRREDAADFLAAVDADSFNLVFARGMSWFHYELGEGRNRFGLDVHGVMKAIMRCLRPGGVFVLQIRTDFSGAHDASGVMHHTWDDVVGLLHRFGDLVMVTDWAGLPLPDAASARASGRNVLAALRRPGAPVPADSPT